MKTVRMKTEDEFIQEFGPAWRSYQFVVSDVGGHIKATTIVPAKLAGEILKLEDHEYEYYEQSGVIRWYDERISVGPIYITKEMIADKLKVSIMAKSIYEIIKQKIVKVDDTPAVVISESVIRQRMKFVKLKDCYYG